MATVGLCLLFLCSVKPCLSPLLSVDMWSFMRHLDMLTLPVLRCPPLASSDMRKALPRDRDKESEIPLGRDIQPWELESTL